MRSVIISIMIIFLIQPAGALDRASSTAEFLLIPPDARSIGLAGSFTAIADDVNTSYWNPAGLSYLAGIQMGYSHNFWFMDFNFDSFSFSYNLENKGTIGGYFNLLWMKDLIKGMDNSGNFSGEYIGASFYGIGVSYGLNPFKVSLNKIQNSITVGASIKVIHQSLYHFNSTTFAFDVGALSKNFLFNGINIGIAIHNLGFNSKFENASEKLPSKLNFGLSYFNKVYSKKFKSITIQPSVETYIVNNYGFVFSSGSEFIYSDTKKSLDIALRVGVIFPETDYLFSGLKAGLGVSIKPVSFDYAISFDNNLNYLHSLSLKYFY